MANKVLTRVWEHSQQRGAARCLIVALADVADEHGIAYPGIPYLAGMINEEEDYTYKLLRKLIEAGELLHKPGGGRGRKTLYAVVVGLSDAQRAKTNTVLQSRVYHEKPARNPALQNTVLQNGVIKGEKPCTFPDTKQTSFTASEPSESPTDENMIHDHDPHVVVGDRARVEKLLLDTTIYPATVRQILALDLDWPTVITSVQNLIAAEWGPSAIADRLRYHPPAKGHPYERQRPSAVNGTDTGRNGTGSAHGRTNRAQAARAPRPGDPAYYASRPPPRTEGPADPE